MSCYYLDIKKDCNYFGDCPVAEYCEIIHSRHEYDESRIESDSQEREDYFSWINKSYNYVIEFRSDKLNNPDGVNCAIIDAPTGEVLRKFQYEFPYNANNHWHSWKESE